MMLSNDETPSKEKLLEELKKLPPEERAELLKVLEPTSEIPIMHWTPNPLAVKSVFNFLLKNGEVELEQIREHLQRNDLVRSERGEYNFGIIPRDGNLFFNVKGNWGANAKVSLTETGEEFARLFDDRKSLRPIEKTILIGLQPYGSAFVYLSILEQHREKGVLREDLKDELAKLFGGKGRYFTGYYTTWFSRIGLIRKEKAGRKIKYKPNFPAMW